MSRSNPRRRRPKVAAADEVSLAGRDIRGPTDATGDSFPG